MSKPVPEPGPYTLGFLLNEALQQLPPLLANPGRLRRPDGVDRVGGRQKLAAWLRLSRLEGCPVCIHLIPALARRRGFDESMITGALDGELTSLSTELGSVVAYADAVYRAEGHTPVELPVEARSLTAPQRTHLEAFVRLERLVHASGLMFLPHAWIRAAAQR